MKKSVFCILSLGAMTLSKAQQLVDFGQEMKVIRLENRLNKQVDFSKVFESPQQQTEFLFDGRSTSSNKSSSEQTPSASVYSKGWGQLTNVDTNEKINYKKDYQYGAGAYYKITLLTDQMTTSKDVIFDIPSTTNAVNIMPSVSSQFGDQMGDLKFFVYIHYFEGGSGPDYQKNKVLVINDKGQKLSEFTGTSTYLVKKENGAPDIIVFSDDNSTSNISLYDATLNLKKSIVYPSNLTYSLAGTPVSFKTINGKDKFIVSHYEKKFMDNATYEVTPDNHLLVKIYDMEFNLEKTIPLDLTTGHPDKPFVFALGNFGSFYFGGRHEITTNLYNNNENDYEILYGMRYEDLVNDKSWVNYYVANEQGTRFKSLEKDIISGYNMASISGKDEQVGFVLGSGDVGSGIQMFDIESWQTSFYFPASHNGQLLSTNFSRIPNGDSYSYLFGMAQGVAENGKVYGVINQYSALGESEKSIKLDLGEDPQMFLPILNQSTLNPHIYNSDDDIEYAYIHKHKKTVGTGMYNQFTVAKENKQVLLDVKGDTDKGDIISSGFLLNKAGTAFDKLAVVYNTNSNYTTTDFFTVPFTYLGTQSSTKEAITVYTDKTKNLLGWTKLVTSFELYNSSGAVVKQGKNSKETSTQFLVPGVYVLKLTLGNEQYNKKVIIN